MKRKIAATPAPGNPAEPDTAPLARFEGLDAADFIDDLDELMQRLAGCWKVIYIILLETPNKDLARLQTQLPAKDFTGVVISVMATIEALEKSIDHAAGRLTV